MDTIDGITCCTTLDTSEVITLDEVVSEELLAGAVLLDEEAEEEEDSLSPNTLLPTILDVKNVALDTTPNSRANPVTATAFGIFFLGGVLPFG